MKKKILIAIIFVVLGIFVLISVYQLTYDKESAMIEYLENKYNQKFTIISQVEATEDDCLYAYSVLSEQNNDIFFIAGKKKEKHIMPFLPPIKDKVFFDDYFEQSKSYVVSKVLKQTTFNLDDKSDINALTDTIYISMEQINTKLSELGFSTTKYTCSIEVSISVNNRVEVVSFYMLDKSVIYDAIYEIYHQ